jgi:O-acetyl-ADP-ribose deacetylase (regulator of RNase III)
MERSKQYHINQSLLDIKFGDITTSDAEVLVSSDDYGLNMYAGVSAAILNTGGNQIKVDAQKHIPADLGDAILTTSGQLPSKYIFHGITISADDVKRDQPSIEIIFNIVQKCFNLMDTLDLNSIAFPVLGTGRAELEFSEVTIIMSELIFDNLRKREKPMQIELYLFKEASFQSSDGLGDHDRFNKFFDEFDRLMDSSAYSSLNKSISLIDNIIELSASHPSSYLAVQALVLRSKFALLEDDYSLAMDCLDQAIPLLKQDQSMFAHQDLLKEVENQRSRIKKQSKELEKNIPFFEKLRQDEYQDYLKNTLAKIKEWKTDSIVD